MKKLSTILLAIVLLLALTTTALAVNTDQSQTLTYREIGIVIDGQELAPTDANGKAVEPFIMKDTTYLPLRAVVNALGLSVHWEAKTHTVTLNSGATPYFGTGTPLATKVSKKATLSYRDIRIVLDGKTLVPLSADGKSAEPFIIDGVTYLPLRALAEALGVNVHWVGSRNLILLTSPANDPSIDELMEQWLEEHPDYGATVIIPGGTGEETASEYPVFFDLGGKGSSFVQTVTAGGTATEPTAPTATGYTFGGWYNGDSEWDFSTPVNAATVLTAKWTPIEYTITFNANSGTGTMADLTGVKYDETKQLTANSFTRLGFAFVEWNTEADGSGASYADKAWVSNLTTTANGSVTLYAQWKDTAGPLCFTAQEASTVTMAKNGSPSAVDLVYSKDKRTWQPFVTEGTPISDPIKLDAGEKVYIKAKPTNTTFATGGSFYYFSLTGKLAVSGNIMSLVDETCQQETVVASMFHYLFFPGYGANATHKQALTDASALLLPATTLAANCYDGMFYSCTALKTAPELPATTLADACYDGMFYDCAALQTAPAILPATTLTEGCYRGMFGGCTALTTAPELPATTLAKSCYYSMFSGCSNLNSITVGFSAWISGFTASWVNGVAASGTFTCPAALQAAGTMSGGDADTIPNGWTVVNPN